MNFQGFVGPTYQLRSVNVDCQRCVNLYPEMIESGDGKEAQVAYLAGTPGLTSLMQIGPGPLRCIQVDPQGRVFLVSGSEVHNPTYAGGIWTPNKIGNLSSSTGPVKAESAMNNSTNSTTVLVDGVDNYSILAGTSGIFFGTFASQGYPSVPGATHVAYVDGYFIFNQAGTNQFFVSNWNNLAVNPLSFASAEGDPSKIMAVIASHRELWLLTERSTEVFMDTGNADFPFERVQGGFIEKGCLAAFSVAKIEGIVFWLGKDRFGQGIVYAAQGLVPQRISNHGIETAIRGYANQSAATAYTYQSGGHSFYVLNFAENTWVYDLTTKMWHERVYTNPVSTLFERHRVDCVAFLPQYGIHMCGDYANNKVYQFDDNVYTDAGDAITRMRIAPHVSNSLKRVFCNSLQIDMETGVGLDGGVQGSNPQAMLDYSDDGGHTWSSEKWAGLGQKIGGIGQFTTRVLWRRLGQFRDRVFRVKITDPIKVIIIGAQLDIEGGSN